MLSASILNGVFVMSCFSNRCGPGALLTLPMLVALAGERNPQGKLFFGVSLRVRAYARACVQAVYRRPRTPFTCKVPVGLYADMYAKFQFMYADICAKFQLVCASVCGHMHEVPVGGMGRAPTKIGVFVGALVM